MTLVQQLAELTHEEVADEEGQPSVLQVVGLAFCDRLRNVKSHYIGVVRNCCVNTLLEMDNFIPTYSSGRKAFYEITKNRGK